MSLGCFFKEEFAMGDSIFKRRSACLALIGLLFFQVSCSQFILREQASLAHEVDPASGAIIAQKVRTGSPLHVVSQFTTAKKPLPKEKTYIRHLGIQLD